MRRPLEHVMERDSVEKAHVARATNMKSVHILKNVMIAVAQNMSQIPLPSAGVEADYNGEYLIDDMVLDEFQFNGIEGIGIDNGALRLRSGN